MVEQGTSFEQLIKSHEGLAHVTRQRQQLADRLTPQGDQAEWSGRQWREFSIAGRIRQINLPRLETEQSLIEQALEPHLPQIAKDYQLKLIRARRTVGSIEANVKRGIEVPDEARSKAIAEVQEFEQRPDQNPLLAKALDLYHRKQEEVEAQKPPQEEERVSITYAEVEARLLRAGRGKLIKGQRRLVEVLLPNYTSKHNSIAGPELVDILWPGTPWEIGRRRLGTTVYRVGEKFSGTGLSIKRVGPIGGAHILGSYYLEAGPEPIHPPLPAPARPEPAKEGPLDGMRKELLERIEVRDGGRHISIDGGETITLVSEDSRAVFNRLYEDLKSPWGDSLGVHSNEVGAIAQAHGYKGKRPRSDTVGKIKDVLKHHSTSIRIGSTPDPDGKRGVYYRLMAVALRLVPPPPEDDFWIAKISSIVSERKRRRLPSQVLSDMGNSSWEAKQPLNDYMSSEVFDLILNRIHNFNVRYRKEHLDEEDRDIFFQRAAGYLFEGIAYSYLYPRYLREGLTYLSPHQKFTVYKNVYPEKRPVDDGFGVNPEIEGVSSPDSFLIKPVPKEAPKLLTIGSVVECKNVTAENETLRRYILKQHDHNTPDNIRTDLRLNDPKHPDMSSYLGRLIHRLIPQLPALPLTVSPEMNVVYVQPVDGAPLPFRGIEPEKIPIRTGEIGYFIRLLADKL